MALGFRLGTLDSVIKDAIERTRKVVPVSDYWTVRNAIARAYEDYHQKYNFWETRVKNVTFEWASGDELDLSTVEATEDSVVTTGVTGWRGRPWLITSSGETYPWILQEMAQLEQLRDMYLAGATGMAYLNVGGWGRLVYATAADRLFTVKPITSQTITLEHFKQPTALTPQVAGTTVLVFPRDYLPILSMKAAEQVWLDALMMTPPSYKQQRDTIAVQISSITKEIQEMEKRITKSLEMKAAARHDIEPGFYSRMYGAAQAAWDYPTSASNEDWK